MGAQRRAGPRLWVVLGSLQEEVISKLRHEREISIRQVKVLERYSGQGTSGVCGCTVRPEGRMWPRQRVREESRDQTVWQGPG